MKLETGVQATIISEAVYSTLQPKPALSKPRINLCGYGNNKLDIIGKCILTAQYKGGKVNLLFYVIKGKAQPLLSRDACVKLELIKLIEPVSQSKDKVPQNENNDIKENKCQTSAYDDIVSEYSDIF